jgi:hypothetical protein
VYDRRDGALSTWYSETEGGSIASVAWEPTGEKIMVHVQRASNTSEFHVGSRDDWVIYQKNYPLSSVSFLPDGQNIIASGSNYQIIMDAMAIPRVKTIYQPKGHSVSVQVQAHPSSGFAGMVERYYSYDPRVGAVYTCILRVIDLSSKAVVDTLALPGSGGEWQWMNPSTGGGRFTGIWRAYRENTDYQEYYYVSLDDRQIVPVHRTGKSVLAVVPGSDRFSVLEGEVLRTRQVSVPVP